MDDGEIEISDHGLLPNPYPSNPIQTSSSIDSFLDEYFKNTTCTHTHTCNPPGPDLAHTHTCHHTHTWLFPPGQENPGEKQKRPLGNREAVRKYREKKKAHTFYLEEEVKKLRMLNQQLVRRLQGQAILEAEILRLRRVLMDLRGKIDGELGVLSLCNANPTSSFKEGGCGLDSNGSALVLECGNEVSCFHTHLVASVEGSSGGGGGKTAELGVPREENCQSVVIDCQVNTNDAEEI